jgi:hypothetical protein
MNKSNINEIIENHKIDLFTKYAEAESKVDARMKIQNDGVSYSGKNFIKYIPDETDRTEKAKKRGEYWSDLEILYWGKNDLPYGTDSFILKREARTTVGQHIKSIFRTLNSIESDVQYFGTKDCNYTKKSA